MDHRVQRISLPSRGSDTGVKGDRRGLAIILILRWRCRLSSVLRWTQAMHSPFCPSICSPEQYRAEETEDSHDDGVLAVLRYCKKQSQKLRNNKRGSRRDSVVTPHMT